MARTLHRVAVEQWAHIGLEGLSPFINTERLRKLVLELRPLGEVELGQKNEGTVISVAAHGGWRRRVFGLKPALFI